MAASSSSTSSPQPHSGFLHFTPNPNPNPNPNSIATFTSRALQKTSQHELVVAERAKRRRQRALRMSRETQIPALALHCASQFPSKPSLIENSFFKTKTEDDFQQSSQNPCFDEASSHLNSSPGGAIVIYDGRQLKNRALEDLCSFSECSGGDGDVSDVGCDRGPDLFELHNWRDGSSSSPSNSTYEGPLNVTRAVSECSSDERAQVQFGLRYNDSSDERACVEFGHLNSGTSMNSGGDDQKKFGLKEDLSAEYWKLQADVLAAECNLLRVEKELALRRWNEGYAPTDASNSTEQILNTTSNLSSMQGGRKDNARENESRIIRPSKHSYHENQAKVASQDPFHKLHDMSYTTSCFAREALQRLEEISNRSSSRRVQLKDPTEALQERLQNLLLATQTSVLTRRHIPSWVWFGAWDCRSSSWDSTAPNQEQRSQMQKSSALRLHDVWDNADLFGVGARAIDGRASREMMQNNRCFVETAALRKQLDFLSLELLETKAAAALIRSEYRAMLSEESGWFSGRCADQVLGEEIYCKAAIQQIVAQVQAESEQWSQIQDILQSLQEEMRILIEARDLWEERSLRAEAQLLSLKEAVHDWRCRAQSAEEEVVMLRSERQALKIKIHNMKQKHAKEHRSWLEVSRPKEGEAVPTAGIQPNITVTCEVEDQPRLANVGTQEDYALCESIVHSRNESSRSSVDLGTTSQRGFQRSIKKSLDFSNSSNDGNTSKSRVRGHRFSDQILKIEPTRLDFCSKTSDVNNKARHRLSGPLSKVELTRLECIEPACSNEHKERKKARLFTFKENRSTSGPIDVHLPLYTESCVQRGSLVHAVSAGHDCDDHVVASKSKSSLPAAPASTPSRLPFGEIFNSPSSH